MSKKYNFCEECSRRLNCSLENNDAMKSVKNLTENASKSLFILARNSCHRIIDHPNVAIVHTNNRDYETPLHKLASYSGEAIHHPQASIVRNGRSETPLHISARHFAEALDHPDVTKVYDYRGFSPIYNAVDKYGIQIAEKFDLTKAYVSPGRADMTGYSLLHAFARSVGYYSFWFDNDAEKKEAEEYKDKMLNIILSHKESGLLLDAEKNTPLKWLISNYYGEGDSTRDLIKRALEHPVAKSTCDKRGEDLFQFVATKYAYDKPAVAEVVLENPLAWTAIKGTPGAQRIVKAYMDAKIKADNPAIEKHLSTRQKEIRKNNLTTDVKVLL